MIRRIRKGPYEAMYPGTAGGTKSGKTRHRKTYFIYRMLRNKNSGEPDEARKANRGTLKGGIL